MRHIGAIAENAGHPVAYFGYPSRHATVGEHVASLRRFIMEHAPHENVHIITHSLGGIVLRHYLARYGAEEIGRIVMIAPPHQGSEVIDTYGKNPLFRWWHGPVVDELGTVSCNHPVVDAAHAARIGIIAGNRSQPLLSLCFSTENDGKVSVASASLPGVADFAVVPFTHTNMLRQKETVLQALHFVRFGSFIHRE
jgi:pimeloyl-ACP methyl ester carboxylesterase